MKIPVCSGFNRANLSIASPKISIILPKLVRGLNI